MAAVVSDRATDAVLADLAVGPGGEAVVLLADGISGADPTGPATRRPTVAFPGTTSSSAPVTYVATRDPVGP